VKVRNDLTSISRHFRNGEKGRTMESSRLLQMLYREVMRWPRKGKLAPWKIRLSVSKLDRRLEVELWENRILNDVRVGVHKEEPVESFFLAGISEDLLRDTSIPSTIDNKRDFRTAVRHLFRHVADRGEFNDNTDLGFSLLRFLNACLFRREQDYKRREENIRAVESGEVVFSVGDVIKHKQFDYRGIVVGFDRRPALDVQTWDGVQDLPSGVEQPFLHVMADVHDMRLRYGHENDSSPSFRYVAQENAVRLSAKDRDGLVVANDLHIDIAHPSVDELFYYYSTSRGRFVPTPALLYKYPTLEKNETDNDDNGEDTLHRARGGLRSTSCSDVSTALSFVSEIMQSVGEDACVAAGNTLETNESDISDYEVDILSGMRRSLEKARAREESGDRAARCLSSMRSLIKVYSKCSALTDKRRLVQHRDPAEPIDFELGQIVRHRKFGYVGVVCGWEEPDAYRSPQDSDFVRVIPDFETVRRLFPHQRPLGVVKDSASNLELVSNHVIAEENGLIVTNPVLASYMESFDESLGRFVPLPELRYMFSAQTTEDSDAVLRFKSSIDDLVDNTFCSAGLSNVLGHLKALLPHTTRKSDHDVVDTFIEYTRCLPPASLASGRKDIAKNMRSGTNAILNGNVDGAIHIFEDVIAKTASLEFNEALHKRAVAFYQKGELDTALSDLERVLEAEPDHVPAILRVGALQIIQNKPDDAIETLQKACDLSPWSSGLATNMNRAIKILNDEFEERDGN